MNKCEVCGEVFENVKLKANHIRWKHKTKKFHDAYKKKLTDGVIGRFGNLKTFFVKCNKCKIEFDIEEREKIFPTKEKYYCSRSCANSHIVSDEHRKKVSNSLKKERKCPICNSIFFGKNKFCSSPCYTESRRVHLDGYEKYKKECLFRFSLNEYPTEFDFNLIEKCGWYSAKNHGDNQTGISRDHIISIRWGFENGVNPTLIRHPANCQLLRHGDNVSKGKKKSITPQELIEKIEVWDRKYLGLKH